MRYFFLFLYSSFISLAHGQDTDLPLNTFSNQVFSNWDIQSESNYFSTFKPVSRKQMASATRDRSAQKSSSDVFELQYALLESREFQDSLEANEKALWGTLYQYPSDFFSYDSEDFDFHLNPIWAFGAGKENSSNDLIFYNYRGVEMRGTIDGKVSFYTMLTENQARFPKYVRNVTDSTLGVPYEGFWKQYEETGVDFLRAQAYINFDLSKHINAQLGYGKHFVGNGRRSLILSDFSNNYPYLRVQTRFKRFQYTNLFAQLTAQTEGGSYGLLGTGSFPRKYLALHHLDFKVTDKLNIGVFESVVFGKADSVGNNGYRIEYLNPVIFYRALEQQDGSSDNAILGIDFKWNAFRKVSIYGQLAIDELILSSAITNDGSWENKQGLQLGVKYPDAFGLKELDLQAEWNIVRPFTYAHQNNYTSYSHYNMPLAHPLGANFREILIAARYRPLQKLELSADMLIAQYAFDSDSLSYGNNILKTYTLKAADTGVELLQGNQSDLLLIHGAISYQWYHNLFTDLDVTIRRESFEEEPGDFNTQLITFSVRYNFGKRDYLF